MGIGHHRFLTTLRQDAIVSWRQWKITVQTRRVRVNIKGTRTVSFTSFLVMNDLYILKQPQEVFYKKTVLKSFAIFTRKHLCWSLSLTRWLPKVFQKQDLLCVSESIISGILKLWDSFFFFAKRLSFCR